MGRWLLVQDERVGVDGSRPGQAVGDGRDRFSGLWMRIAAVYLCCGNTEVGLVPQLCLNYLIIVD